MNFPNYNKVSHVLATCFGVGSIPFAPGTWGSLFADRNYEDDGNLVSRKKPHALITDPEQAKKHVLKMVQTQSLNCHSGKQIPCEIDSVCIHGDNISSLKQLNL